MSRKKNLRKAAEETTSSAAESAAAAVEQAVNFLAPYVAVAKEQMGPAAKNSSELAQRAAERGVDLAHKARVQLEPHVHDALDRVGPAVDTAKAKVQDDLVPRLVDLLHEAEKHPALREASKRSAATLAAVKGDLVLPEQKRSRKLGRRIAKIVAAGALIAGAAVAVRQFLGSKDDGWTAHEPAAPARTPAPQPETLLDERTEEDTLVYSTETPTPDNAPADSTAPDTGADLDGAPAEESGLITDGGAGQDSDQAATGGDASPESSSSDSFDTTPRSYGEGSHVGENPPEGFTIKGNERSMKYHLPESGGYDRTIADVWFNSEDAATAAGFTRAQR